MNPLNLIYHSLKILSNTKKSWEIIYISLLPEGIWAMIANIYFGFQNYRQDFRFPWLPPMISIIMNQKEDNCRIFSPVSGKNATFITPVTNCILTLNDT